jgi:Holliday junction resolvase
MSGRSSKVKGAVYEREIVNGLRQIGCEAERIPLSGALKGNYSGDLRIGPSLGWIAECKRRKQSFTTLYAALAQDNADCLFVRDDNQKTLVVIPMDRFEVMLEQMGWVRGV